MIPICSAKVVHDQTRIMLNQFNNLCLVISKRSTDVIDFVRVNYVPILEPRWDLFFLVIFFLRRIRSSIVLSLVFDDCVTQKVSSGPNVDIFLHVV